MFFPYSVLEAWDEIVEILRQEFGIANDYLADLADAAYDAQNAVDKRMAERKRWGHPPKVLRTNYSQPLRRIKPRARSHICQRRSRRRA